MGGMERSVLRVVWLYNWAQDYRLLEKYFATAPYQALKKSSGFKYLVQTYAEREDI